MGVHIEPIVKGQTDWHLPLNANLQALAEAVGEGQDVELPDWIGEDPPAPQDIGAAPEDHARPDDRHGGAGSDIFGHIMHNGSDAVPTDGKLRAVGYTVIDVRTHPWGADLNNYMTAGEYLLIGSLAMENGPVTTAVQGVWLKVIVEDETLFRVKQMMSYRGNTLYMRYRQTDATNWIAWSMFLPAAVGSTPVLTSRTITTALGAKALSTNITIHAEDAATRYLNVTASKTLALTDNGRLQSVNATSAVVITIPTNANVAFPINTIIEVFRRGTGTLSLSAASGVTLTGTASFGTNGFRTLRKILTDTWLVY